MGLWKSAALVKFRGDHPRNLQSLFGDANPLTHYPVGRLNFQQIESYRLLQIHGVTLDFIGFFTVDQLSRRVIHKNARRSPKYWMNNELTATGVWTDA